jgi:hypothetical protein
MTKRGKEILKHLESVEHEKNNDENLEEYPV